MVRNVFLNVSCPVLLPFLFFCEAWLPNASSILLSVCLGFWFLCPVIFVRCMINTTPLKAVVIHCCCFFKPHLGVFFYVRLPTLSWDFLSCWFCVSLNLCLLRLQNLRLFKQVVVTSSCCIEIRYGYTTFVFMLLLSFFLLKKDCS